MNKLGSTTELSCYLGTTTELSCYLGSTTELSCFLPTKVLQSLIPWGMQRDVGESWQVQSQSPMLRGVTVSWDRGRRALEQAWDRKRGGLPHEAKAVGI